MTLAHVLGELVARLDAHGVAYAVVGGLAASQLVKRDSLATSTWRSWSTTMTKLRLVAEASRKLDLLATGRVAKRLDLTIVCWSVRGLDGLPGTEPSPVSRRVRYGLDDGGICVGRQIQPKGR